MQNPQTCRQVPCAHHPSRHQLVRFTACRSEPSSRPRSRRSVQRPAPSPTSSYEFLSRRFLLLPRAHMLPVCASPLPRVMHKLNDGMLPSLFQPIPYTNHVRFLHLGRHSYGAPSQIPDCCVLFDKRIVSQGGGQRNKMAGFSFRVRVESIF